MDLNELVYLKQHQYLVKEYLECPTEKPCTADGWTILNATSKCFFESCDGSGNQVLIKDKEPTVTKCPCITKRHVIENLNNANIPIIYQNATVDSFDVDVYEQSIDKDKALEAKKLAKAFIAEFDLFSKSNLGLFFFSENKGAGKTMLAISILIELIKEKEIQALYCSEFEILDSIKAAFNSNISAQTVVNRYSTVPFLVIDDFGMEKQTEWVQQAFKKIIDERLSNKRLTIFVSDLTFNEIEAIYKGKWLLSRLQAMALLVKMPEEDVRTKIAQGIKEEVKKGLLNS